MARVLKDEIKLCAHLPTKNCQISKNSAKIVNYLKEINSAEINFREINFHVD